jgi:hypothetical protein
MTCTVMIDEGVVPDELHGPLVDGPRTISAAAVPTSDPAPRIIIVPRGCFPVPIPWGRGDGQGDQSTWVSGRTFVASQPSVKDIAMPEAATQTSLSSATMATELSAALSSTMTGAWTMYAANEARPSERASGPSWLPC